MKMNTLTALIISILILGVFNSEINGQENNSNFYVYTIGNFADINTNSPEIISLVAQIEKDKIPTAIIFTGDITKVNLLDEVARVKDSIRINVLIKQLQSIYIKHLIFLPGDRDWSYSGKDGLHNVNVLERMLENLPYENITWKPGHACPGPKEVEINKNLLLIVINTQYWNHPYEVPGPTGAQCKISSKMDFMEELEDIITETKNRNILIAGHFPIISSGEYGGIMTLKKHLFPLTDASPKLWIPLPIVGSLYPTFRQNVGSSMDIVNENYHDFNLELENIIKDHPGLIYVSGHEYSQQFLYKDGSYYLNSGSLSKATYLGRNQDEIYAGKDKGIARLEYEANGNVKTTAFTFEDEKFISDQAIDLYASACLEKQADIPVNEYYAPCNLNTIFPETMSGDYTDSIIVVAGEEYKASGFKKAFLGWHYRDSWTKPIQTSYLNLDTTFGGLIPVKRGGGRQTTSLKFRGANGCEYTFRSVNKDPKKALSYDLRETIVADVAKDQTSTQQPYGALGTKLMLEELDILHPSPVLYVLPPDDKLGPFKNDFSNLLGMLEESPKSPINNCVGFGEADEVLRSYKLFRNLYKSHNNKVDQHEFAKAKVFDIFVGDWGRHEDNWKWAGYKNGKETIYKAIPRDRDHVFSVWDGLLPWLADREWLKPSGEHFGYKVKDMRSLTWSARHLDRVVLNEMNREDWLKQAEFVQETLNDEVIEASLKNMPPEIYYDEGKEIEDKLKVRRESLDKFVLDYYKLLAKYVDVLGSAKEEKFEVSRLENGSVSVLVTDNTGTKKLYDRTFFPKETKEIRLFGLGNEDVFLINGRTKKSIKIRVIGGSGADSIVDQSLVKGLAKQTLIYEKDPNSLIIKGKEAKQINTWNDKVYEYDRQAFAYNTYFPLPNLSYNSDDGFIIGLGVSFTRQKFGKEDYSAKHRFNVKGSTVGNFQISYDAELHHLVHKWDLIYYGLLANPTDFVYFYGFGNESIKKDSLFSTNFYKTRYNSYQLGTGLKRGFWKRSVFSFIIHYENNESQIAENTILDLYPDVFGVEKVNLFEGMALLDLDFRNDKKFPEKGMRLYSEYQMGLISSNNNSTYSKYLGFLEYHGTIQSKFPIIIGLKGGGAISSGKIPFYKMYNLGQNNYLRGYRKNRFVGESIVFFNSDLKVQLLDIATAFLPIKFGIRGFYDFGRVYMSNENSSKLHSGYGGGIYLIPLERDFSFGLNMAFSEEEKNGLIVFEFGITF